MYIVYPACVYVGTHIERYGKVSQNGGGCTIFMGKDPDNSDSYAEDILKLFDKSKIKYTWQDDPYPEISS